MTHWENSERLAGIASRPALAGDLLDPFRDLIVQRAVAHMELQARQKKRRHAIVMDIAMDDMSGDPSLLYLVAQRLEGLRYFTRVCKPPWDKPKGFRAAIVHGVRWLFRRNLKYYDEQLLLVAHWCDGYKSGEPDENCGLLEELDKVLRAFAQLREAF